MQVFVSYPREREEDAKYLATALRNRAFRVFLDRESIKPGEDWDEAIRRGIGGSNVFVILFDPGAANEGRYFAIELDEIEARLPQHNVLGLVVLHGEASADDLPPRLARFHAITTDGPREKWVGTLLKAAVEFRRSVRRRSALLWSLAVAALTILGLTVAVLMLGARQQATGTVRTADETCVKLISGLGSGALTEFADGGTKVWLLGQSLKDVITAEKDFLLEVGTGPEHEVRLLLMAESQDGGPANPVIGAMADWSDPAVYPSQFAVAHLALRSMLAEAAGREINVEARTKSLVPFSAVVVDWHDKEKSSAARIQFLPKLYRVAGGNRPIFELERRCDPQGFDAIVASIERAWNDATPVRVE